MTRQRELKDLLRETLEKYVHDLAAELAYWVDELNKLDAAVAEGKDLFNTGAPVETAAERWAARTGQVRPMEDRALTSGNPSRWCQAAGWPQD